MKTLEDIKKEYSEHVCRLGTINSLKELQGWLLVAFDDIDENVKVLNSDYRANRNCMVLGSIRNLFPFLFEYEDVSFYEKDNKDVQEAYIINKLYKNYFTQVFKYSTEDNYKEMARLADFMMMYYDKDSDYISNERDALEYIRKGYGYISNCDEDDSLAVHEFFITKLDKLSETKGIEKVKKM